MEELHSFGRRDFVLLLVLGVAHLVTLPAKTAKTYLTTKTAVVLDTLNKTECCPTYSKVDGICNQTDGGCFNNTYGTNCSMPCQCPSNAFASCDITSGNCTCLPGFKGINCTDECDTMACDTSICDNGNITAEGCICEPGWEGKFCEKACSNYLYGNNCSNVCTCNETQACDPITGNCSTCQPGWIDPPLCETACSDWTFGSECKNCSCDRNGSVNCSNEDGLCSCKPGYEGFNCENECPTGSFGESCAFNCTDCETGLCDHVNGTCKCYGKQGTNCTEDCPVDHFGEDCTRKCNCSRHNSNGTCDPCSGACNCNEGWTGLTCEIACPSFEDTCQSVRFFNECNPLNATFECVDGWTGDNCSEVCPDNQYGQNCSSQCNCTDNQYCHPATGECICLPGWTGENCDQACANRTFGLNCSSSCNCTSQQYCNTSNGHCYCDPGFMGQTCESACTPSKYGMHCSLTCNCTECHNVNGSCDCVHGWDGDNCMKAVPVTPEETLFPSKYFYIIVAIAAVITLTVIAVIVIRRRIGKRERDKKEEEFELQSVENTLSNGLDKTRESVIDNDKNQKQVVQENTASVHFDEAVLQACTEDKHEDTNGEITCQLTNDNQKYEPENRESDIYEVKEVVVDEADEKYYADVDNELPKTQVPAATSDRQSKAEIDEEVKGDDLYDRCDNKAEAVLPKSDNTYNTFEEVRKAEASEPDDYDVVEQTLNSSKKKNFADDYNTFAQIRKLSIQTNNASEDSANRISDSYDNLEFENKNKGRLKYDTDVYNKPESTKNMPGQSKRILSKNDKSLENNSLEELNDQEYDSPLFEDNKTNRVSEVMYEEFLEDEIANITKRIESQNVNGNEVLKPSRNETRPKLQTLQSYENFELPVVHGNASVKETEIPKLNKTNNQTMKSKDRKAVDYEDFKLKF